MESWFNVPYAAINGVFRGNPRMVLPLHQQEINDEKT